MTFDLGVWKGPSGLTSLSASFLYNSLCQGERPPQLLLPAPAALEGFYQDLVAKWPDLSPHSSQKLSKLHLVSAPASETPWAATIFRGADYILLSSDWQQASAVLAVVTYLADLHGLTVFDPQSDELYLPRAIDAD